MAETVEIGLHMRTRVSKWPYVRKSSGKVTLTDRISTPHWNEIYEGLRKLMMFYYWTMLFLSTSFFWPFTPCKVYIALYIGLLKRNVFRSCTSSVSEEDRMWGVKNKFSWWFQIGLHSTLVDRRESNFTNVDEGSVQRKRYKRKRKCSSSSCYESASLRNEAKAENDLPIVQFLSYLCNISYNSKTIMHEATFRWNSTWKITQKHSLAEILSLSVWYLVCFFAE